MSYKYAVQFDGGFVRKMLKKALKRPVLPQDVIDLMDKIKATPILKDFDLLRAYYYDAPPFKGKKTNPYTKEQIDFANTKEFKELSSFQDILRTSSNLALRQGDLKFNGWTIPSQGVASAPILQQKGVDVKIALDIAHMSFKHTVDAIVLFSGDIDIVPALKMARREGIWVYYIKIENVNMPIGTEISIHSDDIINLSF